ncbi:MAG: hypothetical protein AAGB12_04715 [Pseudomonadota bacterium]
MIKLSSFGLLLLSFSLVACAGSQSTFVVGGESYQIPSEYLVVPSSSVNAVPLDSDVGMVALSFNQDKDFSDYLGANAWLPKSAITAILYTREGTELTGIPSSFSELVNFSIHEKNIIEFEKIYRVFKGETRIAWQSFPKAQAGFDGSKVKVKWFADCIPLGGMKGSDQSRESMDIPTSCRIDIKHRNAILSLKTSEKNLVDNAEKIISLVLKKVDSWRFASEKVI